MGRAMRTSPRVARRHGQQRGGTGRSEGGRPAGARAGGRSGGVVADVPGYGRCGSVESTSRRVDAGGRRHPLRGEPGAGAAGRVGKASPLGASRSGLAGSAVACNGVQGAAAFVVMLAALATCFPQLVDRPGAWRVRIGTRWADLLSFVFNNLAGHVGSWRTSCLFFAWSVRA